MNMAHQEMRRMGLFGIYRESLKLAFKLRNIFAGITLTLILPLSLTILAQVYVLTVLMKLGILPFVLLEILSSVLALAFTLLSTSAVVYTIACFYTSRDITYRRILSVVVPKVWKRLIVTLFFAFFTIVALIVALVLTLSLWSKMFDRHDNVSTIGVVVLIVYGVGFLIMAMVWQMASVVSVLEDANVLKAVLKGGRLMRGKLVVGVVMSVNQIVAFVGVYGVFGILAMILSSRFYHTRDVWNAVGYIGLCTLLVIMMAVIMIGLVAQTVFYMVCKSYHRENIERSVLGDQLEVIYLGGNVPSEAATASGVGVGMGRV